MNLKIFQKNIKLAQMNNMLASDDKFVKAPPFNKLKNF